MGKAKDGSDCYTKTNKGGGKYVTCEGSQNKRAQRARLKAGDKPPMVRKADKRSPKGKGTGGLKKKLGTRVEKPKGKGGLKKKLGASKIAKPEVVGSMSYAQAVKKGIISQKQADKLPPAMLAGILKKNR